MRKIFLFLVCLLGTGCAGHSVHSKDKCKDLEVFGTVISTHWDCEPE